MRLLAAPLPRLFVGTEEVPSSASSVATRGLLPQSPTLRPLASAAAVAEPPEPPGASTVAAVDVAANVAAVTTSITASSTAGTPRRIEFWDGGELEAAIRKCYPRGQPVCPITLLDFVKF
jgi:hypothetical protein